MLDPTVGDQHRQALDQRVTGGLERRQAQRTRQRQVGIGEDRERQLEALRELALVVARLGREPEDRRARSAQLGVMVTKSAALGRTTARPGDQVPIGDQQRLAWATRPRVGVDQGAARQIGQRDRGAVGRGQPEVRQGCPGKVIGGTVVDGNREVVGQRQRVDHTRRS